METVKQETMSSEQIWEAITIPVRINKNIIPSEVLEATDLFRIIFLLESAMDSLAGLIIENDGKDGDRELMHQLQKIDATVESSKDILNSKTGWTVELLTDFQRSMQLKQDKSKTN